MVTVPTIKSLITRFARSKILPDKPFQTVFQFAVAFWVSCKVAFS